MRSLRVITACFIAFFFMPIHLESNSLINVKQSEILLNIEIDYAIWDRLLKANIASNGDVNYKGFMKSKVMFDRFLNILSTTVIDNNWSTNDKIAYWINVYNAYTIKLIIDNYPVKSIKDIYSPWKLEFFKINNEPMSLGDVEHEILRKFGDPRIHFAINCASRSCPRIIQTTYRGRNLDRLLERQTIEYINNPDLNMVTDKSYKLSKLFSWFGKDFKMKDKTIVNFVNKFSDIKIVNQKNLGFIKYDWELNED